MIMTRQERHHRTDSVSVVIPVYNEEASLPELIERCLAACDAIGPFEIVLVDDGSDDASRQIVAGISRAHPGQVVGIFLNRNYGQHAAVMAGFQVALGDLIVTLDADLQNPPEEIPRIVDALRGGNDVVGTIRAARRDQTFRKIASWCTNRMTARLTGVEMSDYGCMLRGYRRRIVEAMLACRERSTFIPVLANRFARTTAEIEVGHASRVNGESKYGFWQLLNLQADLMTSMSKFPLRLLSLAGFGVSCFGIGLGLVVLVLRLFFGSAWAADGVFTLLAVLLAIVGAQFMGMGLLGEYLGRIYDDVRARPRYFVDEQTGYSQLSGDREAEAASFAGRPALAPAIPFVPTAAGDRRHSSRSGR